MGVQKLNETNAAFLMDVLKKFELDKKLKNEGKIEDIFEALGELGEIPVELRKTISQETDIEKLKSWVRLANRSESIQGFVNKMNG